MSGPQLNTPGLYFKISSFALAFKYIYSIKILMYIIFNLKPAFNRGPALNRENTVLLYTFVLFLLLLSLVFVLHNSKLNFSFDQWTHLVQIIVLVQTCTGSQSVFCSYCLFCHSLLHDGFDSILYHFNFQRKSTEYFLNHLDRVGQLVSALYYAQ